MDVKLQVGALSLAALLTALSSIALEARADIATPIKDARYVVPAYSAGPAVTYPVANASLTLVSSGTQILVFSLPEDLVGPDVAPVTLYENAPGATQYTGAGIQADCESSESVPGETDCKLTYAPTYLHVDEAKVQAFLKRKYTATPEVADQKINESLHFSNDPEGVLTF